VPPLRERREDVRPLASYFVARHAARMNRKPPRISERAWQVLEAHDWPGNVRELENYLERSLILCHGAELTLEEGPSAERRTAPPRPEAQEQRPGVRPFEEAVRELLREALEAAGGRIYGPDGAAALLGLKPTTLQSKLQRYGVRTHA